MAGNDVSYFWSSKDLPSRHQPEGFLSLRAQIESYKFWLMMSQSILILSSSCGGSHQTRYRRHHYLIPDARIQPTPKKPQRASPIAIRSTSPLLVAAAAHHSARKEAAIYIQATSEEMDISVTDISHFFSHPMLCKRRDSGSWQSLLGKFIPHRYLAVSPRRIYTSHAPPGRPY